MDRLAPWMLLALAACGGAIAPTNAQDPVFGIYAGVDTGISTGTISGALAGSGAPAQSVSVTSVPVEVSANAVVAIGPVGLRPNLFAGLAFAGHQQRYIGLGLDLMVAITPKLSAMLDAGSVSDTVTGTPVDINSMNGHRFGFGGAYALGRYGLFARYLRTGVSNDTASATTNTVLLGFSAMLR